LIPVEAMLQGGSKDTSPKRLPHILLVEDHVATGGALVKLLERRGFQLTLATTANDALLKARRSNFDLLISDLGLPDMHGWDLLARIREFKPGVPAIAISGFGREAELKRSATAGFDVHLTKPTRMSDVEAAIQKLFPESAPASRPNGEDPRALI
jgi:DNA-binding response OmpR family regulator